MSLYDQWDDTLPEGIKEIQHQYPNPTKNQYIVLTTTGHITAVPLKHFIRRPTVYQDLFSQNDMQVIEVTGKMLYLGSVNESKFNDLAGRMGIQDVDGVKEHLSRRGKKSPNPYGAMLYYIIERRITGGQLTGARLSYGDINRRLMKLGFVGLVDVGDMRSGSLIDPELPAAALFTSSGVYTTLSTHAINANKAKRIEDHVYDLVVKISEIVLDSEPNTDDPFIEGPDHYYWTFDGMQIRITKTTSSDPTTPNFLFDIETPYGLLYHVSVEGDTTDDIIDELRRKYSRMTQPTPNWKPLDRDILLHNKQMDYKDNSQRVIDIIQEVEKYYPEMRHFARRFKISIKPPSAFSDIDKSLLGSIIDAFTSQLSAREFINRISNNGETTDINTLKEFFPRGRLPTHFEFDDLQKMALVYDMARKHNPNAYGWRVFHYIK